MEYGLIKTLKEIIRNKKGKLILPFFTLGIFGLVIEIFDRAITGSMIDYNGLKYISMMGYTSIWMILVYGMGGLILSCINELPKYFKLHMIWQTLIGWMCLVAIEYISGLIFNVILGLNLWDYSDKFMNLNGQICLSTSLLWMIAIPGFIWVCDFVGWALYREEWYYNVFDNYKELFK